MLFVSTFQWSINYQTYGWLKVLPLAHHHFDLSAQHFCGALCLQSHHSLSLMSASCKGVEEISI